MLDRVFWWTDYVWPNWWTLYGHQLDLFRSYFGRLLASRAKRHEGKGI